LKNSRMSTGNGYVSDEKRARSMVTSMSYLDPKEIDVNAKKTQRIFWGKGRKR
jgi:hypothetical protein